SAHTSRCLGVLGSLIWFYIAMMQPLAGRIVDTIHTFQPLLIAVGFLPLIGACIALKWPNHETPGGDASDAKKSTMWTLLSVGAVLTVILAIFVFFGGKKVEPTKNDKSAPASGKMDDVKDAPKPVEKLPEPSKAEIPPK